jgi:hypothetical protein
MPGWTTFSHSGNVFTFSPPTGTSGAFTIWFTMSDGSNTVQAQFNVVVTAETAN